MKKKLNIEVNMQYKSEVADLNNASFVDVRPGEIKERMHVEFYDVINASLKIDTPEKFCKWVRGDFQHIFPHGMLICGIGLMEENEAHIQHALGCNFPDEYVQQLQKVGGLHSSPAFEQWYKTRRPVLFEMSENQESTLWLENFKRFGLHNIAAHGQRDLNSPTTSYFSFSNIPGKLTQRHSELLDMLVPHLHMALIRAVNGIKKTPRKSRTSVPVLTDREREVLLWLETGKTNWEIAQVLNLSQHTVKNHVQRILIKLKVNTRAQAVAKGQSKK